MATTFATKLNIKPGWTLSLVNAPQGCLERLSTALPENTIATSSGGEVEHLLLFVADRAETERLLPPNFRAVKSGGLIWLAYPKGSSGEATDINRDSLWRMIEQMGWRPVRQIALDETWSAIRFRPNDEVSR